MKRLSLILMVIMLGTLVGSAQSLGDAAKQQRAADKKTPAKHVYTNDDIASAPPATTSAPEKAPASDTEPAATAPAATAPAAPAPASDTAAAKADTPEKAADKDKKDPKEEAAAKSAAFKQKIADQQKAIADQEHELSIMEREHQIRVAEYYADAGTQLRTSGQWFEDEKKYQESLDAKKKAISDAKAKLDDLSEQARKAGVPTS